VSDAFLAPAAVDAWRIARERVPCESRFCECPSASDAGRYSFTYVRDDLGLVYHDVPKAASSYIRREFFDDDNAFSMRNPTAGRRYFSFTVVRNPWDRMVSNFVFFCRSEHRELRKRQFASLHAAPVADFAEFVEIAARRANHHWQPQDAYVPEGLDLVGRMEDLDDAVRRICSVVGVAPKPVYRVNTTEHEHYSRYYDDATRRRVAEMYRRDIERFGYEFEDHR